MLGRSFRGFSLASLLFVSVAMGWSPTAAGADVIRVGAPLPLTGPLSPEGLKQKQG